MDNDDLPIGRVLTRREALALLGATGALLFLGCSADGGATDSTATGGDGTCVVKPELTEGPYYVDEELNRSDIRVDPSDGSVRDGALLALTFNVSTLASGACSVLEGAARHLRRDAARGREGRAATGRTGRTAAGAPG